MLFSCTNQEGSQEGKQNINIKMEVKDNLLKDLRQTREIASKMGNSFCLRINLPHNHGIKLNFTHMSISFHVLAIKMLTVHSYFLYSQFFLDACDMLKNVNAQARATIDDQ